MVRSKIYINADLKQNESVLLKLLSILSNLGRKQYNQRLFELCKNLLKMNSKFLYKYQKKQKCSIFVWFHKVLQSIKQ